MTMESTLREALIGQAETIDLGPLASVDELAGAANRRTRRNRLVTGAGAFVVAVLLVLSATNPADMESTGLVVADEITPDIASQLAGERLQPEAIQTGPGGDFFGLAPAEVELSDGLQQGSVVVRSTDGLTWSFVEGSPVFQLFNVNLFGDVDGLSLVGVDGDQLISARSSDGVSWTQATTELGSEMMALWDADQVDGEITATLFDLTGNDSLIVESGPDVSGTAVCEQREESEDQAAGYRLCGSSTIEPTATNDSLPLQSQIALAYTGPALAYTGPAGGLLELQGGVDPLTALFAGALTSGVERWVVTIETLDGELATVDIETLFPDVNIEEGGIAPLLSDTFASGVAKSPHGFSLAVHRWRQMRPIRDGDLRIENDDFILDATYPRGQATLATAAGETLRTWDQFEFGNLGWSGVDVWADGVIIRSSSGDRMASFSLEEWADGLVPQRFPMTDVIYSPDGRTWSIIATLEAKAQVVAVGDGEVLVRSSGPAGVFQDSTDVLFDQSIPVPGELSNVVQAVIDGVLPPSLYDLAEGSAAGGTTELSSSDTNSSSKDTSKSTNFSLVTDEDGVNVKPFTASDLPPASEVERFDIEVGQGLSVEASADRIRSYGLDRDLDLDNPMLVASFVAPDATFDFYESPPNDDGRTCYNALDNAQDDRWTYKGGGCKLSGMAVTQVEHRTQDFAHYVRLSWAPPRAAWMVVELTDGSTRKVEVIAGMSAAVWPREEPEAVAISLQTADFTEVYAEILED